MSRYLWELKNLVGELRDRYGEGDDSVQQVKHAIEVVEATEPEHQTLFTIGRNHLLRRSRLHKWQGVSSLLHATQRPPPLG